MEKYVAVLPWTIFGRRVHPFSFAVFIALTTISVYLGVIGEDSNGFIFSQEVHSRYVGYASAAGALTLLIGFLLDSARWLRAGLLIGVFVFTSRCALYAIEMGMTSFAMWMSFAFAVGSGGAWLIERANADCPDCRGRHDE